jgi:hypothetical protein
MWLLKGLCHELDLNDFVKIDRLDLNKSSGMFSSLLWQHIQ